MAFCKGIVQILLHSEAARKISWNSYISWHHKLLS
jgi:hypothetical protein